MRRRLAVAAVAATLPCAGLLVAAPAAQADACGQVWSRILIDYHGAPTPDGVQQTSATDSADVMPVNGPGCNDFTSPLDVRRETLQDPSAAVTFIVTVTETETNCVASAEGVASGVPLPLIDDTWPHAEVPIDLSGWQPGSYDVPVTVTCDEGEWHPLLHLNVIGVPDQTAVTLAEPSATSRVQAAVGGRLVSRRTHKGIPHALIKLKRHGLRVGTAYTNRRGYYTWRATVPTSGLLARYRSTVRHYGSRSK